MRLALGATSMLGLLGAALALDLSSSSSGLGRAISSSDELTSTSATRFLLGAALVGCGAGAFAFARPGGVDCLAGAKTGGRAGAWDLGMMGLVVILFEEALEAAGGGSSGSGGAAGMSSSLGNGSKGPARMLPSSSLRVPSTMLKVPLAQSRVMSASVKPRGTRWLVSVRSRPSSGAPVPAGRKGLREGSLLST